MTRNTKNSTHIFYLTNTSLPAKSANTFQSLTMCNEFQKENINVTMLFPNLNILTQKEILELEFFLNNKIFFDFKNIFALQINFLKQINEKLWFIIKKTTFRIGLFFFFNKQS